MEQSSSGKLRLRRFSQGKMSQEIVRIKVLTCPGMTTPM